MATGSEKRIPSPCLISSFALSTRAKNSSLVIDGHGTALCLDNFFMSKNIGTIQDARTLATDYSSAAKIGQTIDITKGNEDKIIFHKVFDGCKADVDRFE